MFDRFSRFAQAADAATGAARFGQGFEYLMVVSDGLADGDAVILEIDTLARYVARLLEFRR